MYPSCGWASQQTLGHHGTHLSTGVSVVEGGNLQLLAYVGVEEVRKRETDAATIDIMEEGDGLQLLGVMEEEVQILAWMGVEEVRKRETDVATIDMVEEGDGLQLLGVMEEEEEVQLLAWMGVEEVRKRETDAATIDIMEEGDGLQLLDVMEEEEVKLLDWMGVEEVRKRETDVATIDMVEEGDGLQLLVAGSDGGGGGGDAVAGLGGVEEDVNRLTGGGGELAVAGSDGGGGGGAVAGLGEVEEDVNRLTGGGGELAVAGSDGGGGDDASVGGEGEADADAAGLPTGASNCLLVEVSLGGVLGFGVEPLACKGVPCATAVRGEIDELVEAGGGGPISFSGADFGETVTDVGGELPLDGYRGTFGSFLKMSVILGNEKVGNMGTNFLAGGGGGERAADGIWGSLGSGCLKEFLGGGGGVGGG
ncbi:hypothetical protein AXG93_815s1200 [Marchantia polymorpha subsp. ruderalis]|uniref:Uncharacterized protein n=1 Tax=Marchantia polymorpha subsp. ruderalis TaxID=1480154 RepID=A0A176W058_MARPO|nr:hypothetical protein AXG93_815s1200 [Marchantia polymorpha subsp. ruderalis]